MLSWFRSRRLKQDHIIELYDEQALSLAEIGGEFASLFALQGARDAHVAAIVLRTRAAHAITGEVLLEVRGALAAPFEQSAISDLFAALDDVIGEVAQTARTIQRYDVDEFDPGLRNLAHVVVDAIDTAGMAVPLLRSVDRYREKLLGLATTLLELGQRAGDLHETGLRALFVVSAEPMAFIVNRELYAQLKALADRLKIVASRIERLV